jgi:hypothetical protein
MVFIGDAFEEEEDDAVELAAALGARGVPVFMLQEGDDPDTQKAFKMISHASGGVYLRFDRDAGAQLQRLLHAVGVYLLTGDIKAVKALAHSRSR